jgi:hypothetical protein
MKTHLLSKMNILLCVLISLSLWIAFDLNIKKKVNFRHFDPVVVGKLDADMWRSYYEKKKIKLFWQMSKLVREQFHAPFWRSFPMAYRAAKAAFVFKEGQNRTDYAKAFPFLENYYTDINALSDKPFDTEAMTQQELEWWIIRREKEHTTADWERILAETASIIYHEPPEKFNDYARLRVEAMFYRDQKGAQITEDDWLKINDLCVHSWQSVQTALRN